MGWFDTLPLWPCVIHRFIAFLGFYRNVILAALAESTNCLHGHTLCCSDYTMISNRRHTICRPDHTLISDEKQTLCQPDELYRLIACMGIITRRFLAILGITRIIYIHHGLNWKFSFMGICQMMSWDTSQDTTLSEPSYFSTHRAEILMPRYSDKLG